MKFVCFGYLDEESWEKRPEAERNALIDGCLAYDKVLKQGGHWVIGEGLQGPETTRTLRSRGGKVSVTDGPYAETKEVLGGLIILEAVDLNEAIELISKHPGTIMGNWEIRATEDLSGMIDQSEKRRNG
jgi:hypothetical protein